MSNVPGLVGIHCPCGRGDLLPRPTTVQGSDKPDKRKVFYHAIFNDIIKTIHSLEELPNSWDHVSVQSRYASWGKTKMSIKECQISRKSLSRTNDSSSTILNKLFNMFARASSVFVLALPVFAAASILSRTGDGGPSNQCNTGPIQCCNSAVAVSNLSLQLYFMSSNSHCIKAH